MKKIVSLVLILLMLVPFAGCRPVGGNSNKNSNDKSVVKIEEKEVQKTEKDKEKTNTEGSGDSEKASDTIASEKSDEKDDKTNSTSSTIASSETKSVSTDKGNNDKQPKPSNKDVNQNTKTSTGSVTNNQITKPQVQTQGNPVKTKSNDPIMAIGRLEFSLQDIEGDSYNSSDIFKGNELTMINIWGTLCTPCIKELPELQSLSEELRDKGIGIIGIIGDVSGDEGLEDAKTIISKKKVEYINLIPNEKLNDVLISKINGYPVTIFVDKEGNLIGEPIIGARSKEEYKSIAEKIFSGI